MFKFFTSKKWFWWSYLGTAVIFFGIWGQVRLDVMMNEWFGGFYNMLQSALSKSNSISIVTFNSYLLEFMKLAFGWIAIAVSLIFFVSHWTFRWRTSIAEYYHDKWELAKKIEGSSQRVQEDALKFARLTEGLCVNFLESIMILVAFIPILMGLSTQITELPFIGQVDHSLVWIAVLTALCGTVVLGLIGIRLPGIEYDIQKQEAKYRKELVLGEDSENHPEDLFDLYAGVQKIHFKSYLNYLYFNVSKYMYLQSMVMVPYFALGPTIVSGIVTLGFVQQIVRAFSRVAESLQYMIRSWNNIVELISVWKRLYEFEKKIKNGHS